MTTASKQFRKGDRIRVKVEGGRARPGTVSRDQLFGHPYVEYRDNKTGGEHTARAEKVERV